MANTQVKINGRVYVALPIGMVETLFQEIYQKNKYDKKFTDGLTNMVKQIFKFSYRHSYYPKSILLTRKVITELQDLYENEKLL